MANKFTPLLDKLILISYLALALVTPLIFSTVNTELFEVPKMHFVYIASVVILCLTLVKFILIGKILIPKNIVLATFSVFVTIQVISTLFSIDKFTSIFGFPSRLNGGLISQFAYLIILAGAIVNLNYKKAKKILAGVVIAAFAVSLWGIPAHFGRDPSCLVLTGKLTASCWQKDFDPTTRIFSTLGQPNWLASYLVLTLPLSIAFLLILKETGSRFFFFASAVAIFWAIILTNSRAGILGISVSFLVLIILLGLNNLKSNLKLLSALALIFIALALLFGTGITTRIGEALTNKQRSAFSVQRSASTNKPTQTALAAGGTESGQIRLIVWQGAVNIFKNWPILGSGPETYVASYFMFRPNAHNQMSEWEFFYNKAHNEFLNYLANTGIVGFLAYVIFIFSVLFSLLKISKKQNYNNILRASRVRLDESRSLSTLSSRPKGSRQSSNNNGLILVRAVLASLVGYLVTIFFGFSVVSTQITMFLIIAAALLLIKNQKRQEVNLKIAEKFKPTAIFAISIIGLFFLSLILRLFLSDVFEKRAQQLENENFGKVLTAYSNAISAHPTADPYLLASYSSSLALAAAELDQKEKSPQLLEKADQLAQKSLQLSPNNFLIAQRIARTYALLSAIDANFSQKAQNIGQRLIELAPNYPVTYLTNAKIQIILENNRQAQQFLQKTLDLKPDYLEARELLDQVVAKSLK